jgi:hypothetical protein
MATGRNYRLLRVKVNPPMIVGASSFSRFDFSRFSFLLFALLSSPPPATSRSSATLGRALKPE